ncbi:glycine-rich domain-containing protein [Mycobacterium decipiens]|uniref:Glycine-rich domain-containing protein-like n=1 Tax=Mycobacterium decipiens TaxID=1430326 RepID=A0A1X2LTV1_9MYCO|nr:hypothetical protein [Mycobacterium decipiens]OSC40327.1 hypothetical protein B8W66_13555 [Mycobacterium decipiens]
MHTSDSDPDRSERVGSAVERVAQIDLSKINRKLQYDEPERWSDVRIREAEEAYRRFLVLNLLYPQERLAVNRDLDDYWHAHILDTQKYAADCERVFGSLLHHYPYFGLPGEEDEGQNVPAFGVTQRIWQETFGVPLVKDTNLGNAPRLTLDRVLTGQAEIFDQPDGGVKGCKNGQHCQKIIAPIDLDIEGPIVAVTKPQS